MGLRGFTLVWDLKPLEPVSGGFRRVIAMGEGTAKERCSKFKMGDLVEVWTMADLKIRGEVTDIQFGVSVSPFSDASVEKFWYQVGGSGLYAENLLSQVDKEVRKGNDL